MCVSFCFIFLITVVSPQGETGSKGEKVSLPDQNDETHKMDPGHICIQS